MKKPLLTKEQLDSRRHKNVPTPVGKKLKELREKKGWTRRQLCRKAELSVSEVSFIESGRNRNPRLDTLLKLSVALSTPIGELLK